MFVHWRIFQSSMARTIYLTRASHFFSFLTTLISFSVARFCRVLQFAIQAVAAWAWLVNSFYRIWNQTWVVWHLIPFPCSTGELNYFPLTSDTLPMQHWRVELLSFDIWYPSHVSKESSSTLQCCMGRVSDITGELNYFPLISDAPPNGAHAALESWTTCCRWRERNLLHRREATKSRKMVAAMQLMRMRGRPVKKLPQQSTSPTSSQGLISGRFHTFDFDQFHIFYFKLYN